jgi:hypothetical protein
VQIVQDQLVLINHQIIQHIVIHIQVTEMDQIHVHILQRHYVQLIVIHQMDLIIYLYEHDIIHRAQIVQDIHVQIHNEIMQVEIITIPEMVMVQIIVLLLDIQQTVEQTYMNHQMEHVVLVQQVNTHQIIIILVAHVLIYLQIIRVEIITIIIHDEGIVHVHIHIQINVEQTYMNHQMEHVVQ